ncbi:MAG: hypothetical protein A2156_04030 [Deltaproteobacteria bacterium RBG_16_48_10]|nr:MAG: hypothetical protein A2156_04030 [Deltaproteobacteria bacterium RBG_16_48_10]
MSDDSYTFLDTDLHIHRLDFDPPVRTAAEAVFETNHPTAISAFSLVELKGNYIQNLILVHRKISDSDSFERAFAKIRSSGGRRSSLMFAQLISLLGGVDYPINPWPEARRQLLTYLDAQIAVSWEEFRSSIDKIFDDLECTRATEPPTDDGERWSAVVPHCTKANTRCTVVSYVARHIDNLKRLLEALSSLNPADITKELRSIRKVAAETLKNTYPWEGTTCRSVGDLLIGLQSNSGKVLISSNYKGVFCKSSG